MAEQHPQLTQLPLASSPVSSPSLSSSSPSASIPLSDMAETVEFPEQFGIQPYYDPKRNNVIFYDIAPMLADRHKANPLIDYIVEALWFVPVTHLLMLESRGFILAPKIEERLTGNSKLSSVMCRKAGKLRAPVHSESYDKEYGPDTIEIQAGAIPPGAKVVIVDDTLATGGTFSAAIKLVKKCNAEVVGLAALFRINIPGATPDFGDIPVICPLLASMGVVTTTNPVAAPMPPPLIIDKSLDDDRRTAIFAMPTMTHTAARMVAERPLDFVLETIDFGKFRDGTPNVHIPPMRRLAGRNAVFIIDLTDVNEYGVILFLIKALSEQHFVTFTIIAPYFATARSDRDDGEKRQQALVTGSTMAELLSRATSMVTKIIIVDIHSLQGRFYFGNNLNPMLLTAKNIFVRRAFESKATILCPDDGAKKALDAFLESADCTCLPEGQKVPMMVVSKSRKGDARIVQSIGEVNMGDKGAYGPDHDYYANIFGIDDMTSTGSTVIESSKAALEVARSKCKPGATPQISWGLTHVFFDDIAVLRRFLPGGDGDFIRHIYTTDSVPHIACGLAKYYPTKFSCFSLAVDYADFVMRITQPISWPRSNECRLICVASNNKIKLDATLDAFVARDGYLAIPGVPTNVVSVHGLSPPTLNQPHGKKEIKECLQARINSLFKAVECAPLPAQVSRCVYIAIENGLVDDENDPTKLLDVAIVRILSFQRNSINIVDTTRMSDPVEVPAEYVPRIREELAKGRDVTLGDLIHQDHPEIPADDWHAHFGNKMSRKKQILTAIERFRRK